MSDATSFLITGPPMTDKHSVIQSILKHELDLDYNNVLTISTNNKRATEDSFLFPISSEHTPPNDLTKIGIEVSKWFENNDPPHIIILEDLQTFEMYVNSESLFRFLHVLKKRIESEESIILSVQTIEESEPNVYKELFDKVINTETYEPDPKQNHP